MKIPQLNRKYPSGAAKEKGIKNNKQGYIYASYLSAEMAFFEYYEYYFFLQILQVF